jgi:transcription elongation factor GreA
MGAPPHFEDGLATRWRTRAAANTLVTTAAPQARGAAALQEEPMKETLITFAGLARLCDELDRLKTTGRQEVAERIRHAVATEADPSAGADYLAAREEQALLEARIARLEQQLAAARIMEPDAANGAIDLGERVRLRDLDTGSPVEFELVSSFEADPGSGRISAESPVGRALLGRREGDVALVDAPKGPIRLRIVAIENPA